MESRWRHRVGCGSERHFGGGLACEVGSFFRELVRLDGHPHHYLFSLDKMIVPF